MKGRLHNHHPADFHLKYLINLKESQERWVKPFNISSSLFLPKETNTYSAYNLILILLAI
jgi:hypothetical protein